MRAKANGASKKQINKKYAFIQAHIQYAAY